MKRKTPKYYHSVSKCFDVIEKIMLAYLMSLQLKIRRSLSLFAQDLYRKYLNQRKNSQSSFVPQVVSSITKSYPYHLHMSNSCLDAIYQDFPMCRSLTWLKAKMCLLSYLPQQLFLYSWLMGN